MANSIHTYRAATMDEALDLVRRELGQDAVVVDSKDVGGRRLLPWSSARAEVEVQAQRRSGSGHVTEPRTAEARTNGQHGLRTLAETLASRATSPLLPPLKKLPPESSDDSESCEQQRDASPRTSFAPQSSPGSSAGSLTHKSSEPLSGQMRAAFAETNLPAIPPRPVLVAQPVRQPLAQQTPTSHIHLAEFQQLVEAGVTDAIARDLVSKLGQHPSSGAPRSSIESTALLTALIEKEMRCAPPICPRPGQREIVALTGPTGVGKTTTLAKLAGHFHLHAGLRVGLITTDTYRVGAVEQIRTYADILQIPLKTAATANEMRLAIDELDDVDLILIDTAGRSPLAPSRLKDLEDVLHAANPDHVLLVLSLATDLRLLPTMAQQFARNLATSLVVTKLDESVGCGGLLSMAREIPLPVSYLTTGQDVPDQIEPTHPVRLARLVLGRDSVHDRNDQTPSN